MVIIKLINSIFKRNSGPCLGRNRESRARRNRTVSICRRLNRGIKWGNGSIRVGNAPESRRSGEDPLFPFRRCCRLRSDLDLFGREEAEEEMATMLRSLAARRHLWSSSSLVRSYSSHQSTALVSKSFTRSPPLRSHPISGGDRFFRSSGQMIEFSTVLKMRAVVATYMTTLVLIVVSNDCSR